MHTLHHQKQKQKARRSPGTKIKKKVPRINEIKNIKYLNKNKSKIILILTLTKENKNISVA